MPLVLTLLATLALAGAAPRAPAPGPFVVVLGIAQDGGLPQAGCLKACCTSGRHAYVTSLALVDPAGGRHWLFDATPDLPAQMRALERVAPGSKLAGVFLTHAHIGHYLGLAQFGREVMGAHGVPVWAMPRMCAFLSSNGPWDQLVHLENISLRPLEDGTAVRLDSGLVVTPFLVPHRDEYSETVGFRIEGPRRQLTFIPDIDKWERWSRPIEGVLDSCDVALLDGTFYRDGELPGRSMAEVPHPFIEESLRRFAPLPAATRARVEFIHLNHTNPAYVPGGEAQRAIRAAGCGVAREGERIAL
jgi:pyrroloquinoline quinone biosynthesis protein B